MSQISDSTPDTKLNQWMTKHKFTQNMKNRIINNQISLHMLNSAYKIDLIKSIAKEMSLTSIETLKLINAIESEHTAQNELNINLNPSLSYAQLNKLQVLNNSEIKLDNVIRTLNNTNNLSNYSEIYKNITKSNVIKINKFVNDLLIEYQNKLTQNYNKFINKQNIIIFGNNKSKSNVLDNNLNNCKSLEIKYNQLNNKIKLLLNNEKERIQNEIINNNYLSSDKFDILQKYDTNVNVLHQNFDFSSKIDELLKNIPIIDTKLLDYQSKLLKIKKELQLFTNEMTLNILDNENNVKIFKEKCLNVLINKNNQINFNKNKELELKFENNKCKQEVEKIEQIKMDYQNAINKYKNNLSTLHNDKEKCQNKVTNLQKEINELKTKLNLKINQNNELNEEIETYDKMDTIKSNKLTEYKEKIDTLEEDNKILSNEVMNLKEEIKENEISNKTLINSRQIIKEELSDTTNENYTLKQILEQKLNELKTLKMKLDFYKNEIKTQEIQLKMKENEWKLREEILNNQINKFKNELNTINLKSQNLQNKIKEENLNQKLATVPHAPIINKLTADNYSDVIIDFSDSKKDTEESKAIEYHIEFRFQFWDFYNMWRVKVYKPDKNLDYKTHSYVIPNSEFGLGIHDFRIKSKNKNGFSNYSEAKSIQLEKAPTTLSLHIHNHSGYNYDDSPSNLLYTGDDPKLYKCYESPTDGKVEHYIVFKSNEMFKKLTHIMIRQRSSTKAVKNVNIETSNNARSNNWNLYKIKTELHIENDKWQSSSLVTVKNTNYSTPHNYIKITFTENHGWEGKNTSYIQFYRFKALGIV